MILILSMSVASFESALVNYGDFMHFIAMEPLRL